MLPPTTGVLLGSIPQHGTGVASGVFNTSRRVGGSLAVAVFGVLLADRASFEHGMRLSLLIAAAVTRPDNCEQHRTAPRQRREGRRRCEPEGLEARLPG